MIIDYINTAWAQLTAAERASYAIAAVIFFLLSLLITIAIDGALTWTEQRAQENRSNDIRW